MLLGNLTRVARESLVLSEFGDTGLPEAYLYSSCILLILVVVYMRLVYHIDSRKILRALVIIEATSLIAFTWLAETNSFFIFWLFGVSEAFHLLILLHIWYMINILFDAKQSQEIVPKLALIGLIGILVSPAIYSFILFFGLSTSAIFYSTSLCLIVLAIILFSFDQPFYLDADQPSGLDFRQRIEQLHSVPLIRKFVVLLCPVWVLLYLYDFQSLAAINSGLDEGTSAEGPLLFISSLGALLGIALLYGLVPFLLRHFHFTQLLYLHPFMLGLGITGLIISGFLEPETRTYIGLLTRLLDDLSYFVIMDSLVHLLYLAFPAEQKANSRAILQGLAEPVLIMLAAVIVMLLSEVSFIYLGLVSFMLVVAWLISLSPVLESYRETLETTVLGSLSRRIASSESALPPFKWQQVWKSKNWRRLHQFCLETKKNFPGKVFEDLLPAERTQLMEKWLHEPLRNSTSLVKKTCSQSEDESEIAVAYTWLKKTKSKVKIPKNSLFLNRLYQDTNPGENKLPEVSLQDLAMAGEVELCRAYLELRPEEANPKILKKMLFDEKIPALSRAVLVPYCTGLSFSRRDFLKIIQLLKDPRLELQLRELLEEIEGKNARLFLDIISHDRIDDFSLSKCIYSVLQQTFPGNCPAIRRLAKSESIFIRVDLLRELMKLQRLEPEKFSHIISEIWFELQQLWVGSQLALEILPVISETFEANRSESSLFKLQQMQLQLRKLYREQGFLSKGFLHGWENLVDLSLIIRYGNTRPFELLNEFLSTGDKSMRNVSNVMRNPSPNYDNSQVSAFLELSDDKDARLLYLHEIKELTGAFALPENRWSFYFENYSGTSLMRMKKQVTDDVQILSYLMEIPMFFSMDLDDLKMLREICSVKTTNAGQTIFREGDDGDSLIIILEGEVEVLKNSENGQILLAKLGHGEVVGDMALLDGETRSATVRTLTDCKLIRIARADFDFLLQVRPSLNRAIMKTLTGRLRDLQAKVVTK